MRNFALTTDGRSPREVETALLGLLPDQDVRLWPYGACQAIIGAPLVRALESELPGGAGPLLRRLGVADIRPLSDAATLELLASRDPRQRHAGETLRPGEPPGDVAWHLRACRLPEAWRLLGGPDRIDWNGLAAGLIDTGYTAHPALGFGSPDGTWVKTGRAASLVAPPPDDETSMLDRERGQGRDNLAGPSRGHGTRVASVLCGHDRRIDGELYLGAAPRLPLLPLRIADTTLVNDAQQALALAFERLALAEGLPLVVVGGGVHGTALLRALRRAINRAYEAGVIVICPAGDHVNGLIAPARLGRCLAIAGTTPLGRPWAGSGYGASVRASAPATSIRRAVSFDDDDHGYDRQGDGTAYAAALAGGAAALWLVRHRERLVEAYREPWQRVEAFARLLGATAHRPLTSWPASGYGPGVLDAHALLEAPLPPAGHLVRAPPV